jgi:hypothetical protein
MVARLRERRAAVKRPRHPELQLAQRDVLRRSIAVEGPFSAKKRAFFAENR